MKNLRLSEIWIYPVKSLGGIRLSTAKVMEKGLLHDRRWMLVDETGTFMTQRVYTQMALFDVSIENNMLIITRRQPTAHKPQISFNITTAPVGEMLRSRVWDDAVEVIEVNQEISAWFTNHLGLGCKLVSFPENHPRPVDTKYKVNNEHVGLADAYPFLIVGQSSLDDLNTRLKQPVRINRFRPNFVFSGGNPYEEDGWREFTIGTNKFVAVKPCSRCVLTTVNPETEEKGVEPLATLATYRKRDNKIYFGQNMVARDHFEVCVGDKIMLN